VPVIFPPAGSIVWFVARVQFVQSKLSVMTALKLACAGSLKSAAEVGV